MLGHHSQLRCVAHSTYTTHDQSITSLRSRSSSILASFAAVLNPDYPRSLNHSLSAGKAPVKKHNSVAILLNYRMAASSDESPRVRLPLEASASKGKKDRSQTQTAWEAHCRFRSRSGTSGLCEGECQTDARLQ